MPLPLHDISPSTARVVGDSVQQLEALTNAAAITWRSCELWEAIARSSIRVLTEAATGDRVTGGFAALGAATYCIVRDLEVITNGEEDLSVFPDDVVGYRRATFEELVAMPAAEFRSNVLDAVINTGNEAPLLTSTISDVADRITQSPHERTHVLSGAALMRAYHIAARSLV